jgi:hypothetical protein
VVTVTVSAYFPNGVKGELVGATVAVEVAVVGAVVVVGVTVTHAVSDVTSMKTAVNSARFLLFTWVSSFWIWSILYAQISSIQSSFKWCDRTLHFHLYRMNQH